MRLLRNTKENAEGLKETSRLEAFSDGVFAIAITLLILELIGILHVPTNKKLLDHLLDHANSFLAFAIGFLTILICWINHHLVFTYVRKVTSTLMWVNGFVLLVVTFTPFPTSILAEYFEHENHIALAIFGFNYFMMSLAAYGITAYVYNQNLITSESRELFYKFKILYLYSIFYTFLVFFICFVSVPAAICLYLILFIVFAYPREFAVKLVKEKSKEMKLSTGIFSVNADCEIVSTRIVNAPVDMVFTAWSDPYHLKNWWGPKGFTNTFKEFDLKPGGKWSFIMHGPDKGNYDNECEFIEIGKPNLIAWNRFSKPIFKVVATFEEMPGNKTRIVFRMIFNSADECDKVRGFAPDKNEENFDRLEEELEKMMRGRN